MTTPKISTVTMTTSMPNCQLNLTNIGKYLPIDECIYGLKYNYAKLSVTKGSYSTTVYKKAKLKDLSKINSKLFYNQITLIVNNSGNHVNVKLFANGSLHLTGCKTIEEGVAVTTIVYNKLKALDNCNDTILLTKDHNGVLLDKDNLVYSYATDNASYQIIGHYDELKSCYIINKREYEIDPVTKMFIAKRVGTGRSRSILNLSGQPIGSSKIVLLKNKTKFYKRNGNTFQDDQTGYIFYNDSTIIGKTETSIDESLLTRCKDGKNVFEINYSCNPFITHSPFDQSEIVTSVNCINVYFTIPFQINRSKLYELLIGLNYICKYKPECYSGVKYIYKMPMGTTIGSETSGHCTCSAKCTCSNITFLIFQSGNIIATGFKDYSQIGIASDHFINLCKKNKDILQIINREF